jgi:hypothetical protein
MRFLIRLLFLLLLACSALGQQGDAPRPRFLIDSIKVEGLRFASERVIVAETRLRPGREYTEPELRAGAARAARLPFVVRLDLRLEKGETRGAYQLIIDVVEAKPVFAGAKLITGGRENDDEQSASIGARLFLGRSGVLHGAASAGDDDGFSLGYTQYDLFGTGVTAAVLAQYKNLQFNGGNPPPQTLLETTFKDHIVTQVIVGVPVYGNHALRASWTREPTIVRGLIGPTRPSAWSVEHISTTELAYIYDSTDDPLFPTDGTSVVATAARRRGPYVSIGEQGPELTTYERPSYTIDARKNWSVAPRHSIWASGTHRHIEREAETFTPFGVRELSTARLNRIEGEVGYALTVWDDARRDRYGDLRLELAAGYGHVRQVTPSRTGHPGHRVIFDEYTPNAWLGLVYRSQWAVLRLRLEVGR